MRGTKYHFFIITLNQFFFAFIITTPNKTLNWPLRLLLEVIQKWPGLPYMKFLSLSMPHRLARYDLEKRVEQLDSKITHQDMTLSLSQIDNLEDVTMEDSVRLQIIHELDFPSLEDTWWIRKWSISGLCLFLEGNSIKETNQAATISSLALGPKEIFSRPARAVLIHKKTIHTDQTSGYQYIWNDMPINFYAISFIN